MIRRDEGRGGHATSCPHGFPMIWGGSKWWELPTPVHWLWRAHETVPAAQGPVPVFGMIPKGRRKGYRFSYGSLWLWQSDSDGGSGSGGCSGGGGGGGGSSSSSSMAGFRSSNLASSSSRRLVAEVVAVVLIVLVTVLVLVLPPRLPLSQSQGSLGKIHRKACWGMLVFVWHSEGRGQGSTMEHG